MSHSNSRSPPRSFGGIQARLDIAALDRAVEYYFRNGLASSTQRSYNSGKRRYYQFCQERSLAPIPASERQLCLFTVFLAKENLAHTTIKCYLSAVRHLHIAEGADDPGISSMARLEQVMKGIKMIQSKGVRKGKERLPITPELLLKLKGIWEKEPCREDAIMLWGAALLCFFGFMRAGEITVPSDNGFDEGAHLSPNDISVDSIRDPQVLKVHIKASKTDPFRKGMDIFVGRTNKALCPVGAVLAYQTARGKSSGPFFRFANGKPLTRERLVRRVREALAQAGVDYSSYSGHSFRSGAATTAARCGVADATIKMLGRWKSSAYQLYIKTPRDQLARMSQVLLADSRA